MLLHNGINSIVGSSSSSNNDDNNDLIIVVRLNNKQTRKQTRENKCALWRARTHYEIFFFSFYCTEFHALPEADFSILSILDKFTLFRTKLYDERLLLLEHLSTPAKCIFIDTKNKIRLYRRFKILLHTFD